MINGRSCTKILMGIGFLIINKEYTGRATKQSMKHNRTGDRSKHSLLFTEKLTDLESKV